MDSKLVNNKINECYISFCSKNNMSSETGTTIAKFRTELIKEIKNLFNEENLSNAMMKDLVNNFKR